MAYTPQDNPVLIVFVTGTSYTPPLNGAIVMDFANAYDGSGVSVLEGSLGFFMILTM